MQFVNQYSWRAFNFFLSSSSCDITPSGTQLIFHPPQFFFSYLHPSPQKETKTTEKRRAKREKAHTKIPLYFFLFFYLLNLNVPFFSPCRYPAMQPAQLQEIQEGSIVFGNTAWQLNPA